LKKMTSQVRGRFAVRGVLVAALAAATGSLGDKCQPSKTGQKLDLALPGSEQPATSARECGGVISGAQVISVATIGFLAAMFRSQAGRQMPRTECKRSQLSNSVGQ
jgi:hypothetical protein